MRRLIGFTLMAITVGLAGCKPAETLDDTTRLIYLAPFMPCEEGDPGYGIPNCLVKRVRDAVVVLRVPKHFSNTPERKAPEFLAANLVLLPDKVLTGYETGDYKDFVKQEKIAMRNYSKFEPDKPLWVSPFRASTGWQPVGQKTIDIASYEITRYPKSYHNGPFVEIPSYFSNYKTYDNEKCVGHIRRISPKGQLTEESTCDRRQHLLIPVNRPDTTVLCPAPQYQDGQLLEGHGCLVTTEFELRKVDGRIFSMRYSFISAPIWISGGHWQYIDQRVRDWIKSMDVTDQQLLKGK